MISSSSTCAPIPHEQLHAFVSTAGQTVGLSTVKAELLARMLTDSDLRGNFSHGTRQMVTYAKLLRDGQLNPSPHVSVVKQTPTSLLVDGDGGLGYFPVYEGTQAIIEKAKSHGIAVMATRNHGHIGAAGIYARMTLDHDLVSFVTSGHQLLFEAAEPLYRAAGGSPMTFSAPAGRQHPLVLDFGTMHDLYASDAHRDEIARLAPRLVLRFIGLGEVCQAWGGLLTGLTMDGDAPGRIFAGANQGAIVMAFRIDLFVEPDEFKRQMDAYVRRVQQLRPLPGYDRAYLAGGVEAARRREYLETGVPITQDHRQALEQLASTLGIVVPWR